MSAEERKQVAEDKKKNAEFHVLDETPFWSNRDAGLYQQDAHAAVSLR